MQNFLHVFPRIYPPTPPIFSLAVPPVAAPLSPSLTLPRGLNMLYMLQVSTLKLSGLTEFFVHLSTAQIYHGVFTGVYSKHFHEAHVSVDYFTSKGKTTRS